MSRSDDRPETVSRKQPDRPSDTVRENISHRRPGAVAAGEYRKAAPDATPETSFRDRSDPVTFGNSREKAPSAADGKIRLDRPLLVEGRYDKNTLSQVATGVILPVGGFSVFHNDALIAYLRRLAEPNGLLILTDSDGGGGQIRRFLSSVLPKDKCTHLYIPQKEGKERRKKQRGKAGLLGVEGMPPELLRTLLSPYDAGCDAPPRPRLALTKADLYALTLSGHPDSSARRAALAAALSLPTDLTPDGFLQAVNTLISPDDFAAALRTAGLPPLPDDRSGTAAPPLS